MGRRKLEPVSLPSIDDLGACRVIVIEGDTMEQCVDVYRHHAKKNRRALKGQNVFYAMYYGEGGASYILHEEASDGKD